VTITRLLSAAAIALATIVLPCAAAAQDTLARVKDLYTSAAYDEALALINQAGHPSAGEAAEVDQYRAFCLLALGRSDDARQVIQQIVEANPSFLPSDTQASPRLLDAFRDVRRRVLPSMVRQSYADAKAAFERKDFEVAGKGFDGVVTLLDDEAMASTSELSDLRILSKGFLDLIRNIPLPAPAGPAPAAIPLAGSAPARAPASAPAAEPAFYGPGDPDVTPPVAISQVMPPWHPSRQEAQIYDGRLILDIDEKGQVVGVTSQGGLHLGYGIVLRRAARTWKFQPATKNGVPVKYRKIVAIHLNPTE
jgi:tetratricopeptide (TPR) repeat protein